MTEQETSESGLFPGNKKNSLFEFKKHQSECQNGEVVKKFCVLGDDFLASAWKSGKKQNSDEKLYRFHVIVRQPFGVHTMKGATKRSLPADFSWWLTTFVLFWPFHQFVVCVVRHTCCSYKCSRQCIFQQTLETAVQLSGNVGRSSCRSNRNQTEPSQMRHVSIVALIRAGESLKGSPSCMQCNVEIMDTAFAKK